MRVCVCVRPREGIGTGLWVSDWGGDWNRVEGQWQGCGEDEVDDKQ